VMCGHLVVGAPVETTSDSHKIATVNETGKILAWNALLFHFTRAEDSPLVSKGSEPIYQCSRHVTEVTRRAVVS